MKQEQVAVLHVSDAPGDVQRAVATGVRLVQVNDGLLVRVVVNGAALEGLLGSGHCNSHERVRVEACEYGLAQRGFEPSQLKAGVGTVEMAAAAMLDAQFAGAAYLRI